MPKQPPLTKKKQKWAKGRDVTLRGTPLNYNASRQLKYKRAIERLVKEMTDITTREVKRLFNGETAEEFFDQQEVAAMDASIASKAKKLMNSLAKRFDQLFGRKAPVLAERMVNGEEAASTSALHSSLKQLSGGLTLKTSVVPKGMEDVTSSLVTENVNLIKSIPEAYLKDVTGAVMRSITFGNGLQDLVPSLMKYAGITYRRAKNIAEDQTRKAYNSINKQKMQAIGFTQFEWLHSGGGQKPRDSHIAMSGNIYSFDDLPVINQENVDKGYEAPERGIPGQAINCRCRMIPVVNFDER